MKEITFGALENTGLKVAEFFQGQTKEESYSVMEFTVRLYTLKECKVPKNLVKVTRSVELYFGDCIGMSEEILNFIFELEKKCEGGVELLFAYTQAFTQSDWDFLIENVVNNPSLKFGKYELNVDNQNDLTFNLNTDRELGVGKWGDGNLTLNGKTAEIEYYGNVENLKVEGKFKDIVDIHGNSIVREVVDYDNLPDLYESLDERLRRLTSQ